MKRAIGYTGEVLAVGVITAIVFYLLERFFLGIAWISTLQIGGHAAHSLLAAAVAGGIGWFSVDRFTRRSRGSVGNLR